MSDVLPPASDHHDWPPGSAYAAVRHAVEKEWAAGELVLVSEWSAAKSHDVAGVVVRAWMRDAAKLRAIGPDEYGRLAAQDSSWQPKYVHVRFHVCEDARHVVFAIIHGPLAGIGGKCWIDPAKPELTGVSWIS